MTTLESPLKTFELPLNLAKNRHNMPVTCLRVFLTAWSLGLANHAIPLIPKYFAERLGIKRLRASIILKNFKKEVSRYHLLTDTGQKIPLFLLERKEVLFLRLTEPACEYLAKQPTVTIPLTVLSYNGSWLVQIYLALFAFNLPACDKSPLFHLSDIVPLAQKKHEKRNILYLRYKTLPMLNQLNGWHITLNQANEQVYFQNQHLTEVGA